MYIEHSNSEIGKNSKFFSNQIFFERALILFFKNLYLEILRYCTKFLFSAHYECFSNLKISEYFYFLRQVIG